MYTTRVYSNFALTDEDAVSTAPASESTHPASDKDVRTLAPSKDVRIRNDKDPVRTPASDKDHVRTPNDDALRANRWSKRDRKRLELSLSESRAHS